LAYLRVKVTMHFSVRYFSGGCTLASMVSSVEPSAGQHALKQLQTRVVWLITDVLLDCARLISHHLVLNVKQQSRTGSTACFLSD
jgi:hypothetical protein